MVSKSLEKLINEISGLSVLELAELTKALEDKFGISAAVPAAASTAAFAAEGVAPVQEEKSEFKVEIVDAGSEKIKAIKVLRKVKKDLGLTEAKKMVESAPVVIAESVSKTEAEEMKRELEAAGVKVKLS